MAVAGRLEGDGDPGDLPLSPDELLAAQRARHAGIVPHANASDPNPPRPAHQVAFASTQPPTATSRPASTAPRTGSPPRVRPRRPLRGVPEFAAHGPRPSSGVRRVSRIVGRVGWIDGRDPTPAPPSQPAQRAERRGVAVLHEVGLVDGISLGARPCAQRRVHGANKPPRLMARLIEFFTKPGELVLDPFAGVGGTLLGAAIARGPRRADRASSSLPAGRRSTPRW